MEVNIQAFDLLRLQKMLILETKGIKSMRKGSIVKLIEDKIEYYSGVRVKLPRKKVDALEMYNHILRDNGLIQ